MTGFDASDPPVRLDGPKPMTENDYVGYLAEKWPAALTEHAENEAGVQDFLERHPCLVPGFSGVGFSSHLRVDVEQGGFHHYAWHRSMVAQPSLPGPFSRKPDFMWIASNSEEVCAILIEIERPSRRYFNANGDPSAAYSHALGQIAEWRSWFGSEGARVAYRTQFGVDRLAYSSVRFTQRYVLIMGRREEFDRSDRSRLIQKRSELAPENTTVMSFDRLQASKDGMAYITSTVQDGVVTAKFVPPVFVTGPGMQLDGVQDLVGAVGRSDLPEGRKEFLAERVSFWQDWRRARRQATRPFAERLNWPVE